MHRILLIQEPVRFIAGGPLIFMDADFRSASSCVKDLNVISYEVSLNVEKRIRVFTKPRKIGAVVSVETC
jgi:hypothetical protein